MAVKILRRIIQSRPASWHRGTNGFLLRIAMIAYTPISPRMILDLYVLVLAMELHLQPLRSKPRLPHLASQVLAWVQHHPGSLKDVCSIILFNLETDVPVLKMLFIFCFLSFMLGIRAVCCNCLSPSSSSGPTPCPSCGWAPRLTCILLVRFCLVGKDCANLWLGYAYCVKGPASTSTYSSVQPPAPTQPGVDPKCNQYHKVVSGDDCSGIESAYSITFAQLYKWNPGIGSNCESLWLGYAVCVGVSS